MTRPVIADAAGELLPLWRYTARECMTFVTRVAAGAGLCILAALVTQQDPDTVVAGDVAQINACQRHLAYIGLDPGDVMHEWYMGDCAADTPSGAFEPAGGRHVVVPSNVQLLDQLPKPGAVLLEQEHDLYEWYLIGLVGGAAWGACVVYVRNRRPLRGDP